jgi:hypothetical protein
MGGSFRRWYDLRGPVDYDVAFLDDMGIHTLVVRMYAL